ncbi:MAG: Spy/CpxP family protein refolding chaperone [Armatimonadota bacterium]
MRKVLFVIFILFALSITAFADSETDSKTNSEPTMVMETITVNESVQGVTLALRVIEPHMLEALKIRLKLTDEQVEKVKSLLESENKNIRPLVGTHLMASQEFAVEISSEYFNEEKLKKASEKLMKAETDLINARLSVLAKFRAILTDEQQKQLAELMKSYTAIWQPVLISPVTATDDTKEN